MVRPSSAVSRTSRLPPEPSRSPGHLNGTASASHVRADWSDIGLEPLNRPSQDDLGQSHVVHLVTPRACDSLAVGDVGVVVLGSVDPYGVGPHDIYNFFYVLGPGHTSAAEAAALLSALPATDTTPSIGVRGSAPASPLMPLIAAAAVGIAVLVARFHVRGASPRGRG